MPPRTSCVQPLFSRNPTLNSTLLADLDVRFLCGVCRGGLPCLRVCVLESVQRVVRAESTLDGNVGRCKCVRCCVSARRSHFVHLAHAERLNIGAGLASVGLSLVNMWAEVESVQPALASAEFGLSAVYFIDTLLYFECWKRKNGKVCWGRTVLALLR